MIKEHSGRGIWRCLYDPDVSLLITAGFDSAIKAHRLLASSSGFSGESLKEVNERRAEVFTTTIPNLSGHIRLMDSKSEYVRCLKFAREDTIYVATNRGYVYHARASGSGSMEWTELVRPSEEVPIICMDVLFRNLQDVLPGIEDWIAVGDGKGAMKVVNVVFTDCTPQVAVTISWSAEMERQLLGAYWCRSLGCGFIFTSNPRGLVKLWKWSNPSSHAARRESDVHMVAEFMSPFGARIMCLDASCEEEVLVCGDLRGNLVLFPLTKCILFANSPQSIEKTPVQTYFKGAHGISTVSSISIARFSSSLTEIRSTGADGCICYLEYDRDQQLLEFVGMKQIKELSLVESVSTDHYSVDDSVNCSYAVGFSSTDFLIWNLHSETKLLQVKCGGWRRPHSYHLGHKPEMCSSFAYVKDEVIYVHRYPVLDGEKNIFPRNLHLQFHGREIHCLCIIPEIFQSSADANPKSSWIATGCEDGTVRLTRYRPGENWSTSNLLGEHVGGSAVRSLCFVSEIHSAETKVVEASNGVFKNGALENVENPCLLISVGAKRVLTSWLLRNRQTIEVDGSTDGLQNKYGGRNSSSKDASSMSFKWLSTDMPTKGVRAPKKMQDSENLVKTPHKVPAAKSVSTSMDAEQTQHGDTHDDDWRYLSVTAFLVSVPHSRLTVCFVIVSCSDATLTLRALVLPYRYWFDVACLTPLSSPVLALQHVVIPLQVPHQGEMVTRNAYIVVSGSTDGSIAFWDVSGGVDSFMQRVSSLHMEKFIDFQKRPRTGRGSQGGRWWRSIDAVKPRKKVTGASVAGNGESITSDEVTFDHSSISMTSKDEKISSDATQTTSVGSEESFSDSPAKFAEIKPLHVLNSVHQSGVNCLHICNQNIGNDSLHSVLSGGDDQALNFLQFVLSPAPSLPNLDTVRAVGTIAESESAGQAILDFSNESCSIKFLSQNKVVSAHSSAVKGVWTNGVSVFSTGLDQRVRCWKLQEHCNLSEYGHFITSVPEPEALDVRACGRNCYQVVVSGRGMQMVEIFLS